MTSVTQISKGLDLPIAGAPEQKITGGPAITRVAVVGDDYVGMKPTMAVNEGDRVKLGQLLFEDKKTEGVRFTAPAAGTVVAVNRGDKRKFLSVVIECVGDDAETFAAYPDHNLSQLERGQVVEQLLASGLWTALRTRPYSRTPAVDSIPHAIFITAIDTNPLAADPAVVLAERSADFIAGVQVLSTLTDGTTYVCRRAGAEIPGEGSTPAVYHAFDGPHPAGLPGTHIHLIAPVSRRRTVWHVGYQDCAAIGHLFLTGRLNTERIVAIAGPAAKEPRLVRTQLGVSLEQLTAGEIITPEGQTARVITGSVLNGRKAAPQVDYLGRFHNQVSLLVEGTQREFLGWLAPGQDKFSLLKIFASAWTGGDRKFKLNTSTNGSSRAIIPLGVYEDVVPLDIVATALLKAIVTDDIEYAQQLGVLELDEEDLALCTFVDPGKHDFGPLLRKNLTRIEVEG
ncbi:MAG: NADH:ubiquinone reductase (Na(+)-transporting) subunit A [Planctomycetaceae bacterium]|nr:NADH:ubiquinone reductase (Na(+)-transporting) subunit A [Planctomycetaceae bacterium]